MSIWSSLQFLMPLVCYSLLSSSLEVPPSGVQTSFPFWSLSCFTAHLEHASQSLSLGHTLFLKIWLLPLGEEKSSSWLQPHHFFPGWVGISECRPLLPDGPSHLPAHMQWIISGRVFLKSPHLSARQPLGYKCRNVHPAVPFPCVASKAIEKVAAAAMMTIGTLFSPTPLLPLLQRLTENTLRLPCSCSVATVAGLVRHPVCWENGMNDNSCLMLKKRSRVKSHSLKQG